MPKWIASGSGSAMMVADAMAHRFNIHSGDPDTTLIGSKHQWDNIGVISNLLEAHSICELNTVRGSVFIGIYGAGEAFLQTNYVPGVCTRDMGHFYLDSNGTQDTPFVTQWVST
eukprot:scaffold421529_cov71-Attheya_sp.AAC.1